MSTYTPEQQAVNRRLWVKALRSGDYEQTDGALRGLGVGGEFAYCCLGVACDLFARTGRGSWSEEGDFLTDNDQDDSVLPTDVVEWLGLDSDNGQFDVTIQKVNTLIELNDNLGYDFERIADVIEAQPPGLIRG